MPITYITAADVAAMTGYTVATVRAKFADGSLPAYRLHSGHWRAIESEIRAVMQGRPVTSRGEGADITAAVRAALRRSAARVVRRAPPP